MLLGEQHKLPALQHKLLAQQHKLLDWQHKILPGAGKNARGYRKKRKDKTAERTRVDSQTKIRVHSKGY